MTRSVGTYADYKGTMQPVNVSFPEDCAASKFNPDLTNVPSYDEYCKTLGNANWTPDEFARGDVYIDKVQKVKIYEQNSGSKLYIKAGTYDFSETEFYMAEGTEVFLLPGVTLTLNNNAASTAKFTLYIASTSTLIANGANGLRMDNTGKVYNHGTIECSRFEVNNTAFLYNVGTLTSTGEVYIANNTSRIVNDGTINSASTNVEGSGALQNNAEWNVTGNTIVSCTNGGWVNNGHWKTQNYGYTAGSENVINNCFLEVTEDFDINTSQNSAASFKIDTGGGVLTKNFNGGKVITDPNSVSGPYKIVMGNESVFKVTGTATLDGGNKGWGFFGPADGKYAVFQAKDVKRGRDHSQGMVTYGGNLYVSAETHFTNDDQYNPSIYFEAPFTISNIYAAGDNNFSTGNPDITIPTTPCNPGFGGGGSDNTESIRVIGEDLTINSNSDFDFNDIVFDVIRKNGKIYVKFLAAGGELPIYIGPDNNSAWELHGLFADKEKEVAEKGGKTARNITTKTMMNTRAGKHQEYPCPELELPSGWWDSSKTEISDIANSIEIRVQKSGTLFVLKAPKGEAPSKIAVGTGYVWCNETDNIDDIYKGNFKKYVEGESGYEWNNWYNK